MAVVAAVDGDILVTVEPVTVEPDWHHRPCFKCGTVLNRRKRDTLMRVVNRNKISLRLKKDNICRNKISPNRRVITSIALLSLRITNKNTFDGTW